MNHSIVALALTSALFALGSARADELDYSNLEARLNKIESQLAVGDGIQQAAYCGSSCDCGSCDSACGNGCSAGCSDCCSTGCCNSCNSCGNGGGYYADVELLFMRAHVAENAAAGQGKLSEEYEIAPRFTLGYENCCGQGARVRYWHYGHQTNSITDPAFGVRFEWDVIDFEVTNRLQFTRTDVTLAGGVRYASTDITQGGNEIGADLIGLTMAADLETLICCDCDSYWSFIYGGRLSILGGDWEGAGNAYIPAATRDDNVVVTELSAGVEYGCCYCGNDIYTQLKFEMQNWHSDVLSANANADSIGFIGPVWTIGMGF